MNINLVKNTDGTYTATVEVTLTQDQVNQLISTILTT
jgi:hypothetical protein